MSGIEVAARCLSDMTERAGVGSNPDLFLTEWQHCYQIALLSPVVEPLDQGPAITRRFSTDYTLLDRHPGRPNNQSPILPR